MPGNFCQPCDCHGNVDFQNPNACDKFTGQCQGCQGNTEGYHCDSCVDGYYGTAFNADCHCKLNILIK